MENLSKNNKNNIILNPPLLLNNSSKGINYQDYINQVNENKINEHNEIKGTNKINQNFAPMFMNSFYTNMLRYNLLYKNKNNYFKPISTQVNSLLLDFNKELSKENMTKEKQNITKNNNKIKKYNFEPLIKKLESQEDERFKKSRFLQFIKDINSNKLIINDEKNIIEKNPNYKNDEIDENNFNNDDKEINELEDLLNKVKLHMDNSREDLAKSILEQIFDNSKIKMKENKNYLEKAYLFMILCYFNENEDLLGISLIIDLLYIITEDNNNSSRTIINDKKYLSKEYIEKINQRDFDITDKKQYDNYINNRIKIHEEIENYIKNIIIENKKEDYNQLILLLYGLILYLNEKYNDAEQIFNQLIILDNSNYFYYNTLGVIYANQKKYDEAISFYKKALEINQKYPKCLINFGVLLSNKGEYKESSKYLISALKIFDDIPEGWNYLLANIIELNQDDLICEINNRNLKNIEDILINKK